MAAGIKANFRVAIMTLIIRYQVRIPMATSTHEEPATRSTTHGSSARIPEVRRNDRSRDGSGLRAYLTHTRPELNHQRFQSGHSRTCIDPMDSSKCESSGLATIHARSSRRTTSSCSDFSWHAEPTAYTCAARETPESISSRHGCRHDACTPGKRR